MPKSPPHERIIPYEVQNFLDRFASNTFVKYRTLLEMDRRYALYILVTSVFGYGESGMGHAQPRMYNLNVGVWARPLPEDLGHSEPRTVFPDTSGQAVYNPAQILRRCAHTFVAAPVV